MTAETERLNAAFAAVHRPDFLTEQQRSNATQDRPLFIGHGQTELSADHGQEHADPAGPAPRSTGCKTSAAVRAGRPLFWPPW